MKNNQSLQCLLRQFCLIGACLLVLFPAVVSADQPVPCPDRHPDEELICLLNSIKDDLAFLIDDAKSVKKDIKIDGTFCFSHTLFNNLALGVKAEFGAEWPMLVSINAKGNVDLKLAGTKLDLGTKICIKVPLYKVASNPLGTFDNTASFDEFISTIVAPSQAVVPLIATLFTAIDPSNRFTPGSNLASARSLGSPSLLEQSIQSTANVLQAATGLDIYTGNVGLPKPEMLLRPDLLFEPVIGEPYQAFLDVIPTAFASAVTNPCQTLADSPLKIDLTSFDWICAVNAETTVQVLTTLRSTLHGMCHAILLGDPLHFCNVLRSPSPPTGASWERPLWERPLRP